MTDQYDAVFYTSALTRPLFTDAEFTATKWDSAAEKAAFANALCRFIAADFRESLFTQKLYRRLALSFGHIVRFERGCFYDHFFRDLQGKGAFLEEMLPWVPCGEPSHTFCDVERAVLARLRKSNLLDAYRALRAAEVEGAERALLVKLRAKYEVTPTASQTRAPILHPGAPPKTRRSGQQSGQTSLF